LWKIRAMTVVVDSKKRVKIRTAQPGARFSVQTTAVGKIILTPIQPEKVVPIVKTVRTKEGFLMFPPGKGPDRAAIRAAIREERDKFQS
jgi:DNA-binding IclR family transcriptional regulator